MNKNLEKAICDIGKAEGLMYAIEMAYINIEVLPQELEKADRAVNTFYALWDEIKNVTEDLERLIGDEKVVDVIYAVNNAILNKKHFDN